MPEHHKSLPMMTIMIFTTGGTIDKTYFDSKNEYAVGEPQAAAVMERANVVVDYQLVVSHHAEQPAAVSVLAEASRATCQRQPREHCFQPHGDGLCRLGS